MVDKPRGGPFGPFHLGVVCALGWICARLEIDRRAAELLQEVSSMRAEQRVSAWAGLVSCALAYALLVLLPLSYAVRSAMYVPKHRARDDGASLHSSNVVHSASAHNHSRGDAHRRAQSASSGDIAPRAPMRQRSAPTQSYSTAL